jgi:signal transduction histidine kinase
LQLFDRQMLIALSAAFANLLASDETRRLAEVLQASNQELQTQQEELQMQAVELRQQTEEIRAQNVELEQQRLAVEAASRLKSQFLSNMSHELRTPLNSVMALSRVLSMGAKDKLSEEELNYLEIIERNGKNLLTLINDILDLAKIESGRMDVKARPFSLATTLENIVESLSPLAGEKNLTLQLQLPEALPPLESDEVRVAQILQNLIANGVKFTDVGSVTVSAGVDGGKVVVEVADTGIGIAEGELPYIFDEFRQVDGSASRRHEGTGLGLAIARKAAEMLGGGIVVSSRVGLGSTFTLTLPLVWQDQVVQPGVDDFFAVADSRQHFTDTASPLILLIEDNEAAIIQVRSVLETGGYRVAVARGGAGSLRFCRPYHPRRHCL